ncbi:MAG: cell wall-active antibiotics response protein [Chloroflexi bacterium]|nr:cell wall-active antibiotics response protein [Chloroflexota bacterium]
MTANRRFLYWGVLLVALGGIVVAADLELVTESTIRDALSLWPLILIALGVAIVVRRTRYSAGAWLVAAALPGLAIGGLFAAGPRLAIDCLAEGRPVLESETGQLEEPASISIRAGCGSLSVTTAEGSTWRLAAADADNAVARVDASSTSLDIDAGSRGHWGGDIDRSTTWHLTLPTSTIDELDLTMNAGQSSVDLDGARIGSLRLTTNAGEAVVDASSAEIGDLSVTVDLGSTSISLPAGADIVGSLDVNLGELKVCLPEGLGLRVTQGDELGEVSYEGRTQDRGAWQSPDYERAAHHVDLLVNVSLGSLEFNPMGGCK